jgi:hypothetical protein
MWFRHISENIIVKTMYLVSFLINIGLDLSVTTPLKKWPKSLLLKITKISQLIYAQTFCNM